ncbi:MAG: NAD-dependent epimerase/dehydratase family protein [Deltaproteobacteria bacterium]|nr:MAG: NAD-dependent epimerase/dehydratase family protein [Deltaproteobacteria bacterium]
MATIDPKAPVMVTGATGYVAGWLVKTLLDRGHTVHAAVRDPGNAKKRAHLDAMAEAAPGEIRYFAADLLTEGAYAEAMKGCELVFHTASPFTSEVKDPQKELVEPAQLGTRNVLEEANRTESVRRVVVTSSCAAVYGDNIDMRETPNGIFDEAVWNTSSSLAHQPYSYSKTVAEQEAWKIAEAQGRWDLVVLNPALVMGPGTNPFGTSESFALLRQFGDGTFKIGAPAYGMGVVDVRDLAEAHYRAGFTPEANGRNIIVGHNTDIREMATLLRERFGDRYPLPKRSLPKWVVWLVGPMKNKLLTRKVVNRNIGLPWKGDNAKGVRELGLSYRPLDVTLVEMFEQMAETGGFDKAKA